MDGIGPETLAALRLADIAKVSFHKRDEITTDLICCEVQLGGTIYFFHEEMEGWDALLRHLQELPGFRSDWFTAVAFPAFQTCETVAFKRE